MNIVRRSLSAVKGGRLAEAAPRSRQISLYVSDVNRGDLASVASGPTMPTETTLDDFRRVIDKYHLLDRFPSSVGKLIREDRIPPMPRSPAALQRSHHVLLDNYRALAEARCFAEDLGFTVEVADDLIEGEVEELARKHIERLDGLRRRHTGQKVCLISGGEVICPVRGSGRGGRNQEFVLRTAANLHVQGDGNTVVLSAGTDGIDGNSPAAGAIAGAWTIQSAQERGFAPADYLRNSDSFTFLANAGATIVTGPTGNNVRDLRLLLGQ
jgi:hydroxypyruvate reductase